MFRTKANESKLSMINNDSIHQVKQISPPIESIIIYYIKKFSSPKWSKKCRLFAKECLFL